MADKIAVPNNNVSRMRTSSVLKNAQPGTGAGTLIIAAMAVATQLQGDSTYSIHLLDVLVSGHSLGRTSYRWRQLRRFEIARQHPPAKQRGIRRRRKLGRPAGHFLQL